MEPVQAVLKIDSSSWLFFFSIQPSNGFQKSLSYVWKTFESSCAIRSEPTSETTVHYWSKFLFSSWPESLDITLSSVKQLDGKIRKVGTMGQAHWVSKRRTFTFKSGRAILLWEENCTRRKSVKQQRRFIEGYCNKVKTFSSRETKKRHLNGKVS